MTLTHRDALERRYDGPIPAACPPVLAAERVRLFQRLAHEAREQAAWRRTFLSGSTVLTDRRLGRLGRDLCLYRSQGLAWRG